MKKGKKQKSKNTEEKTLDEILAPVRQEVAEKGITEEEIDDLVKKARKEIFAEKKVK